MTTSINFNLDGNIDLNSVFTLQYNFDMLKSILESLLKAQKQNNKKIKDFEDKLEDKDRKIIQMQNDMEYYKMNMGNPTLNYSDTQKCNLDEDKNSDLLKTIMVSVDINFYLMTYLLI
jgi:hypothetical protein